MEISYYFVCYLSSFYPRYLPPTSCWLYQFYCFTLFMLSTAFCTLCYVFLYKVAYKSLKFLLHRKLLSLTVGYKVLSTPNVFQVTLLNRWACILNTGWGFGIMLILLQGFCLQKRRQTIKKFSQKLNINLSSFYQLVICMLPTCHQLY